MSDFKPSPELAEYAKLLVAEITDGTMKTCPSCRDELSPVHGMRGWSVACKCGWSAAGAGYRAPNETKHAN